MTLNPDEALVIKLVGDPKTKKTSNRIFRPGKGNKGRAVVMPSQSFENYRCEVMTTLVRAWRGRKPLREPVWIEAEFNSKDRQRKDLNGLMQALGDLMVEAGILQDDFWIHSWDGTRRICDREKPVGTFIRIRPFQE